MVRTGGAVMFSYHDIDRWIWLKIATKE